MVHGITAGAESKAMHSEIESLVEEIRRFRYKGDDVIPEPDSCAVCGEQQRNHGLMYSKRLGYHQWVMPENSLRLKRMKARRQLKNS
jgi:hypothetical protein